MNSGGGTHYRMSIFSKFLSVGSATMASRVLGFLREALIAAALGAGPVADAFYAAFRFPNLFRRLFAEGAFNTAFVPLFAREVETGGKQAAQEFAEQVFSALLVILLLISALAMIFMPFLVGTVIAPKFAQDPAKFDLTVLLTRIMFPYLAAMSLVAMFSGILNAFRKYFLAALAPVLLNVVLVLVLLFALQTGMQSRVLGIALAWGVMVAGLLQLFLLLFGVTRQDFRFSLKLPSLTPNVRKLLLLAFPTAIANGITQVNLLVSQIIASAQDGAIAVMNYADRLVQLPLGIIAISIGVVLLPELTRALASEDHAQANQLQNQSLEFGLGLTIPAAVGLFMIPEILVALVYERGAFARETTEITARVLAAFALGLPAFVLIKIFQPAFYAREDMRTPMWFSGVNAALNIVLALMLFPRLGVVGLGIATSIAGWANAILLAATLLIRRQLTLPGQTWKNLALICLASAAMAGLLFFGSRQFGSILLDGPVLTRIFGIAGLIAISAITYFLIVMATGAMPLSRLRRLFSRNP